MPGKNSTRLILAGAAALLLALVLPLALARPAARAQARISCAACHTQQTPGIVTQWRSGKMGQQGIDCATCHGSEHSSADDVDKAKLPTPDVCATCHAKQVEQFRAGKHSLAWTAMKAMPMLSHQPLPIAGHDGFKGCSGCHKIGEKAPGELTPAFRYGTGSCDSCHTRHSFSAQEALNPRACQTCHMGFDHPQWEMWSTSKHGTIWQIEGNASRAPTCQTCHMDQGNHTVMTAWGFLALRLPEDDKQWWQDRVEILQALGVLDAQGGTTDRMKTIEDAKLFRLTLEDFQAERGKTTAICARCHSAKYVEEQMTANDKIIRESDALMAEAIRTVQALYTDGLLEKPTSWTYAPDLLQFYEAKSSVEQELYVMFMEYRMRAFQGAFHANPDYMHWYGWAAMKESLQKIKDQAAALRAEAANQATLQALQAGQKEMTELKPKLDKNTQDIDQLNRQVANKQDASGLPLLVGAVAAIIGLIGLIVGIIAFLKTRTIDV